MGGQEDIAYQNCKVMLAKYDKAGIRYQYSEYAGGTRGRYGGTICSNLRRCYSSDFDRREFVVMKKHSLRVALSAMLGCGLLALATEQVFAQKTLKDAYKDYFPVGVAVAPRNLSGPEAELIIRQFNSITLKTL